jgi:signal transduction histidine kinase
MIAVLAFAALVSISLITLTTYLHRTTVELSTASTAIRLMEELEIDLLRHAQSNDDVIRSSIEQRLLQQLQKTQQYVGSEAEKTLLTQADQQLRAYLLLLREDPPDEEMEAQLSQTFQALDTLVQHNLRQAEAGLAAADRWDRMGNYIGWSSTALLLILCGWLIAWLSFAFRPVLRLQEAMREFGSGVKSRRAPETGPEELRAIARQFNAMADAISRQHENQSSFLAGVAHDLRNPLNALKLSAAVLGDDASDKSKVSAMSSLVRRQVDHLDRMVGDLLDASRIEAGRLELRMGAHDARTLARDVYDLFRASSTLHQLQLVEPDDRIEVYCDAIRIEQVLINLVVNGLKYSPEGGAVRIAVSREENRVIFQVSDQGLGIPEDELPYIFEPFRRTRFSSGGVPGTGLGLSVARRIVLAHDGHIEAHSRLGLGTTVTMSIPVASTAAHDPKPRVA